MPDSTHDGSLLIGGGVVAVGSSGTATRRDALAWFWRP